MEFAFTGKTFAFASALAVGLVSACETSAAPATIGALMVRVINPAANSLWNVRAKNSLSDMNWDEIKQTLATLSAAAVTVTEGGTVPAQRDRAKSAKWREWSRELTLTVQAAKRASDRKDRRALATAGDRLVTVCQGCHMAVAIAAP
jgi:hypothetical protein